MKHFDKSIFEEEYKKTKANVLSSNTYQSRGSNPSYFSRNGFSLNSAGIPKQAVVKVIYNRSSVKDLVSYVANLSRTGTDDHIYDSSGSLLSRNQLFETAKFWDQRDKQDTRKDSRKSTHIILSTSEKATKKNIKKLKEAVSEVASNHFTANGFDCFFTIHTDKPHLHAHLVVHNRNLISNKKIRISPADLFTIRKDFADSLNSKGWNYTCSLRKDSMEIRDGIEGQRKHQKYVLNQVEKELGPVAREWTKKQFILKFSSDKKKSASAKSNLDKIRNLDIDRNRQFVMEEIEKYEKQHEKWRTKELLRGKYPDIEQKHVNSYVDYHFATLDKLSKSYNSKDPESVKNYETFFAKVESLKTVNVKKDIIAFAEEQRIKRQREKEIKNFNLYGDIGRLYLSQLYRDLDKADSKDASGSIILKIDQLLKGKVEQPEIDFFRHTIMKKNTEPYGKFYKYRAYSIRKDISKTAGVPLSQVKEVDKIFSIYCARRGENSVNAYRLFVSGVSTYTDILKSGDKERLSRFLRTIDQKLAISQSIKDKQHPGIAKKESEKLPSKGI